MLLDFDPAVTGIASQPFWLRWHDQADWPQEQRGRLRLHGGDQHRPR
jgi:hypothetical protein